VYLACNLSSILAQEARNLSENAHKFEKSDLPSHTRLVLLVT